METNYARNVSDAASSVAGQITKKAYPAPKIPTTPSHAINEMLHTRCGKSYDNPVKAGIAHYIAIVFTVITKLYEMLHKNRDVSSHTMWMAACGIVATGIVLKVIVVYQVLIASAFLVHFMLYYAAVGLSLFAVGLGVAGAVFFDKRTGSGQASTGFSESIKTTVRETQRSVRENISKFE